jgi:hypothetical protein
MSGNAHHQHENIDDGPPGSAGAEGPGARHHQCENVDGRPLGGARAEDPRAQRLGARPSGRAVNGCRNLGANAQRVVRIYFTLTQVGHFY